MTLAQLESLERSRSLPAGLVRRAEIVLLCAEGRGNFTVAEMVCTSRPTVAKWHERFRLQGLMGLYDEPRPGRPRTIEGRADHGAAPDDAAYAAARRGDAMVGRRRGRIVGAVEIDRPTHVVSLWCSTAPAKHFKLSTDPFFVEKLMDVTGLYLNPPEHAMVLCVHEKSHTPADVPTCLRNCRNSWFSTSLAPGPTTPPWSRTFRDLGVHVLEYHVVAFTGDAHSSTPARKAVSSCSRTHSSRFSASPPTSKDCVIVTTIYQHLVERYGYAGSYDSVKRYVRHLKAGLPKLVVGVMQHAPGEEAQVDYFHGAPTLHPKTGSYKRPWVFRITLCHTRHGYEEAVWKLDLPTFLHLHERAFRNLGGVVRVIRHDNMTAGVSRACQLDPDSNVRYLAFAAHWGFVPLPTRPYHPEENGKQERSGGYCKHNAYRKGERFETLDEHNVHLRRWNERWARMRVHGTTRRQVYAHYVESDLPALQPCRRRTSGSSSAVRARCTWMHTST